MGCGASAASRYIRDKQNDALGLSEVDDSLWAGTPLLKELVDCDQSGENILKGMSPEELKETLEEVDVDNRIALMDLPTRLLVTFSVGQVKWHQVPKAASILLPAEKLELNSETSYNYETLEIVMPRMDEQVPFEGGLKGLYKKDSRTIWAMCQLPWMSEDTLKPEYLFDGENAVAEGVAFGLKLLGPALPTPRVVWNDLAGDEAQGLLAYYGLGQIHLSASDDPARGEHMVDLRQMVDLKVRKAFERFGACAYFKDRRITSIFWSHGDKWVAPGDADWEHAKFAWRCSLGTWVTAVDHLVWTHWICANAINVSARECLPPEHPIRRVLHVSLFGTSKVNMESVSTLGSNGSFLHRMCALEYYGGLKEAQIAALEAFEFQTWPDRVAKSNLPEEAKKRLPLFVDGLEVWNVMHRFYKSYVAMHYQDDDAVRGDTDLAEYWTFKRSPHYAKGLPALSKAALVDQLTHACFSVTAWHNVVGDITQYVTMPNSMAFQVRPGRDMADARQMANILALTASCGRVMPRLIEDWSHLLAVPGGEGPEARKRASELHAELVSGLEEVSENINQRSKACPMPFTEFDPVHFECSVSI
mmetsp:Transcript_1929/g.4370  ORF Transcript_1929/g.4370 Transcript_1929/m.4370 type:complete len:589 (-) Transcript_1929:114-1880(-)